MFDFLEECIQFAEKHGYKDALLARSIASERKKDVVRLRDELERAANLAANYSSECQLRDEAEAESTKWLNAANEWRERAEKAERERDEAREDLDCARNQLERFAGDFGDVLTKAAAYDRLCAIGADSATTADAAIQRALSMVIDADVRAMETEARCRARLEAVPVEELARVVSDCRNGDGWRNEDIAEAIKARLLEALAEPQGGGAAASEETDR